MNVLSSNCTKCRAPLLVSQAAWSDPLSHVCMGCGRLGGDDEFEPDTEEEEGLVNPFNEFDLDYERPAKGPTCDCGAAHTSLPGIHSEWCSVNNK